MDNLTKVVVKFGNSFDTDGVSVGEALLLKKNPQAMFDDCWYALTPEGVGIVTLKNKGEINQHFCCTHHMPCPSYEDWAARNWGIDWDYVSHLSKDLVMFEKGIKSDLQTCNTHFVDSEFRHQTAGGTTGKGTLTQPGSGGTILPGFGG